MSRSALLIIDVQLGMYDGKHVTPIYHGEEKIKKIAGLIDRAKKNSLSVIYVRHNGGEGHPLEPGSTGFNIHAKISPGNGDLIIEKSTPDSFLNTSLQSVINEQSISTIYVVGNQTDFCVDTTCRSAWAKGLNVVLVGDCHSTWDSGGLTADQIIDHHNNILGNGFAAIKHSKEITFKEYAES